MTRVNNEQMSQKVQPNINSGHQELERAKPETGEIQAIAMLYNHL